jgi:hypothetical protein
MSASRGTIVVFLMMIASILVIVVPIFMSIFSPALTPFLSPRAPHDGSQQDGDKKQFHHFYLLPGRGLYRNDPNQESP